MLNDADRQLTVQIVATHLRFSTVPRADIFSLCPRGEFGIDLGDGGNPRGWAEQLITMLVNDGWAHEPPWLVCVLSTLAYQYQELAPVLARVNKAPPIGATPTDPLDDLWLDSSGTPFIDRAALRDLVRKLADPATGPCVLLVNGKRKSGKSYTVELLRHWQHRRQAAAAAAPQSNGRPPSLALVPHYRGMGASLTPEELARKIVNAMERQDAPLPERNATPNRTGHYLVDWILEQAEASGKEWWVVIDSLNDPDLLEQTRNLVSILAQCITGPIAPKAIRLILIDYPSTALHGVLLDQQAREQIGTIGEIDVKPFFSRLLSKNGPVPDHQIETFVRFALSDVPPGDLCELNRILCKVAMAQGSAGGQ